MNEFVNYKRILNKEEIDGYTELLAQKSIPFRVTESVPTFDITFTGNSQSEFWIQIKNNDFETVNKLFENDINIESVEDDHYLSDFSKNELIEVVEKPYEWSSWDVKLAKELLKEKGIVIDEKKLKRDEENRIELMSEPEKVKEIWISLGYLFAFLGGFFAIMIAFPIINSRKNLPNGKRVFTYDKKSRSHAKNIIIIGLSVILFGFIFNTVVVNG